MPYLAREGASAPVYVIDEVSLTKCAVTKVQRQALSAVGMPSPVTVPAGTLAAFTTITVPILTAIQSGGDDSAAFQQLVAAALAQVGLTAATVAAIKTKLGVK